MRVYKLIWVPAPTAWRSDAAEMRSFECAHGAMTRIGDRLWYSEAVIARHEVNLEWGGCSCGAQMADLISAMEHEGDKLGKLKQPGGACGLGWDWPRLAPAWANACLTTN